VRTASISFDVESLAGPITTHTLFIAESTRALRLARIDSIFAC
jgi:hypothetical protein